MEQEVKGSVRTTRSVTEIVSGFVPHTPTSAENYRFGAHLTSYLSVLVEASPLSSTERAAAVGIGAAKFPRFEAAWVGLTRPIPRPWFAAVSGIYGMLDRVAEADVRAYDVVSSVSPPVTWFTERLIPGVYRRQPLPTGLSEVEAVRYLVERAKSSRFAFCLGCGGLRTYWFWADRGYDLDLHRPAIRLTRAWIISGQRITPTSRIR